MYYKLNEKEKQIIEEIVKITSTDYELLGNFIPVDSFISIIEDMKCEYEMQKEKYEDLERDLESNYKPLTPSEMGWDIDL